MQELRFIWSRVYIQCRKMLARGRATRVRADRPQIPQKSKPHRLVITIRDDPLQPRSHCPRLTLMA